MVLNMVSFVMQSTACVLLQNKEVAVNVEKLPEGTVVFEDIGTEKKRGKILKTLKLPQNTRQGDPLAGRIVYETLEGYKLWTVVRSTSYNDVYSFLLGHRPVMT